VVESIVHYDKYPLLFNVDEDPSESFPLCTGDVPPTDREAAAALNRIQRAYAMERATFQYGDIHDIPNDVLEQEEGFDQHGVCCNTETSCYCKGGGGKGSGLFYVGTKGHHDAYHNIVGEVNHMKKATGHHKAVHAPVEGMPNNEMTDEQPDLNQTTGSLHGRGTMGNVAEACSVVAGAMLILLLFIHLRGFGMRRHEYDRIPAQVPSSIG